MENNTPLGFGSHSTNLCTISYLFSQGGTLIGTARSKTFRTPEGRKRAALNLILAGIDALAVCGGDGSLTGADRLRDEWPSLVKSLLEDGE